MTGRGAVVLGAPLLLVALSAAASPLFWPAVAAVVAAAALVVVDGRRAPGRRQLRAVRSHAAILSAGARNPVTVTVTAAGRRSWATVRDEGPAELPSSHVPERRRLPVEIGYTVTPRRRGEARMGRVVVRAEGPWRLGFRQTALGGDALEHTVRVDADISAVAAYEALARRGQLAELGVRAQRRPGEGTEFERIREALPDDPLRLINWPATARTGRPMAVDLIPEPAQPVVVCLDHGRLMGVGAGGLTKLDHAVNAALLLVHVALRAGDRAGLVAFSDRVTAALPPAAGRARIREFLDAVRPLSAEEVETDYDEVLPFIRRWQRRRALVAVFTDVADPDQASALVRQCVRLRARHLPLVITVRDPALDDLLREPPVDAPATYRRAVASGLAASRDDTVRLLAAAGVETLDADARTLSPGTVNRYLELKRRGRL